MEVEFSIASARDMGSQGSPVSVRLSVSGELDLATVRSLRQQLFEAERYSTDLVVDLCRVSFIDAGSVDVLVRSSQRVRAGGRSFRVLAPNDPVRRVLRLLGLDDCLVEQRRPDHPAKGIMTRADRLGAGGA